MPDIADVLTERTAIEKVVEAIIAVVAPVLPGVRVEPNRSDQEQLDDSDLPAVIIGPLPGEEGPAKEQGQLVHSITIQFDCIAEGTASLAINQVNQRVIATMVRELQGDPTLGGRLEDLELINADASEQSAPDAGWAVLQMRATYYTPSGDLFTLVGQGGAIF